MVLTENDSNDLENLNLTNFGKLNNIPMLIPMFDSQKK